MDNSSFSGSEIAIIGMAGRFPKSSNVSEFWENIKEGRECITCFDEGELKEEGLDENLIKHPDYVKSYGWLEEAEEFDNSLFDYSEREASLMDPQMRLMHEVVWEALEDSGYNAETYDKRMGFYAGASDNLYWQVLSTLSNDSTPSEQFEAFQLNNKDFLATQIAHKFNLKGPAMLVSSACSTSLAAVHMACQAILGGECEIALAGGATVSLPSKKGYLYQEGMILSPDGHCRAFDNDANGIVGANGIGVVVLKLLEDALKDGDNIHAIIRGSAMNNDGRRKAGYSAPSVEGQAEVIRMAHRMAEINADTISYVEAHGTGTSLGDLVEVEALKQAFGTSKRNYCAIGSVKSNIGHLDSAAGVAGLIKAVLILKHKTFPPAVNLSKPNARVDFNNSPFYINRELKKWTNEYMPLRAGVSSFGIGGTNVHVVLEEAPGQVQAFHDMDNNRSYELIPVSASSTEQLKHISGRVKGYVDDHKEIKIQDLAYTLQVGRKHLPYREAFICKTLDEFSESLASKNGSSGNREDSAVKLKNPSVFFMFTGQGSQYRNMGADLQKLDCVFNVELNKCLEILKKYTEADFREIFYAHHNEQSITDTSLVQPFLLSFEYALAKTLMSLKIIPQAMIGHSLGEYVAACLSGVFSLEDALYIVVQRGNLMQRMHPGAMLSVSAAETAVKSLIDERYSLAAINSPNNIVISGGNEDIELLARTLEEKGHLCRKIHTSHAFHSKMIEQMLGDFYNKLKQVTLNKPKVPFLSNLTGTWITDEQATSAEYWCMQLRHTIRFEDGLTVLLQDKEAVFIEVGPGNTLCSFLNNHKDKTEYHSAINIIRHIREEIQDDEFFLRKIAQIWTRGININWEKFYQTERKRISLPTYPFLHKNYANKGNPLDLLYQGMNRIETRRQKKEEINNWFYLPVWKSSSISSWDDESLPEKATYLLFADNTGFGGEFQNYLKGKNIDVVIVAPGEKFQQLNEKSYIIAPADYGHYKRLFENLEKCTITRIIHTWSISTRVPSFEDAQKKGFYSVLYILKALGSGKKLWQAGLNIISNGLCDIEQDDTIIPENATLSGLMLIAQQENSLIYYKNIDISIDEKDKKKLFDQIAREVNIRTKDRIVAYRGTRRWVQIYERLKIDPQRNKPVTQKNGIYLITGGLGKLGLLFAEHLALAYGGKVALLTRSYFPEKHEWPAWIRDHDSTDSIGRVIEKLYKIEAEGGEVEVFQVDISDHHLLSNAITRIENQWGRIRGVIHAAAQTKTASIKIPLDEVGIDECNEQFRPKVLGTIALEKALEGRELDFCILFSSLSSVLGGLGFVAYAAANSFMDSFVQRKNKELNAHWMSVNWDSWKTGEENDGVQNGANAFSIEPEQGKVVFDVLVQLIENQVVISTNDLQKRLDKWVSLENISGVVDQDFKQNSKDALEAEGIEAVLTSIWKEQLGESNITINDSFFDLGGDSLKAVSIIARIQKNLGKKIELSTFFKNPTIANVMHLLSDEVENIDIKEAEDKDYYPLCSSQERLLIINQLHRETTSYNLPQILFIEGELDVERLKQSFNELMKRHEALRASFHLIKGVALQKIHDDAKLDFTCIKAEENKTQDIIDSFIKPFELEKPPLWRSVLIETGPDKFVLLMDFHHIISDGGSFKIFFEELSALYNGLQLTKPVLRYRDYCEWENSNEYKVTLAKQKEFWLEQFAKEVPILALPVDFARKDDISHEGSSLEFEFDAHLSRRIHHFVTDCNSTKFIFFLTVMNVFLSKLSGSKDIVIGTPVAGRNHYKLQNVFGHFLNVLPLRNYPESNKEFKQFLKDVENNAFDAFDNQNFSYKSIVENLGIKWKADRNPLFDVMLVMQNIESKIMDLPGLVISPYKHNSKASKFDLTLEIFESEQNFSFLLEYCTELFSEQTVKQFIEYLKRIVIYVLDNQNCSLADIRLSSRKEAIEPMNSDFEFD